MEFDFEMKCVFGMYHFFWVAFNTDQKFLILKSIFPLILRQMFQGFLLFLY